MVPLDLVPTAMLVARADGTVLAVNGRWVELSGLAVADSLGTGWLAALAPAAAADLLDAVARAVSHGQADCPLPWGGAARGGPAQVARWQLVAHRQAGEVLVGLGVWLPAETEVEAAAEAEAVSPAAAAGMVGGPVSTGADPFLSELPGLLRRVDDLMAGLARLVDRLADPVPA